MAGWTCPDAQKESPAPEQSTRNSYVLDEVRVACDVCDVDCNLRDAVSDKQVLAMPMSPSLPESPTLPPSLTFILREVKAVEVKCT